MMKLITNNPKFLEMKYQNIEIIYINNSYIKILEKVRDFIHMNYELLTHPLYGSIKPNETIYRSVLINESKENKLHIKSEMLIGKAIETYYKFQKNKKNIILSDNIKNDFSVIDYDLISTTINRILK